MKKNITSLSTFKRYADNVPLFLHNRPRPFLEHCMKRIDKVHVSDYTVTSDGYRVVSPDSGLIYTLDMSGPSCTCPDWLKFNWPCKHILGILTNFPADGWDFLPPSYTSIPLFNLDVDFSKESQEDDSNVCNSKGLASCKKTRGHIAQVLKEVQGTACQRLTFFMKFSRALRV